MYRRMHDKAARRWRDLTTRRVACCGGPAGAEKTGLVLYLDYEREFAHPDARISAALGFSEALRILDSHGVRATWNCVGLIGEQYPETIEQLLERGQEVASHTHRHIVPGRVPRAILRDDLQEQLTLFRERFGITLRGFHSPQDNWSRTQIGVATELGFAYDIAVEPRSWHWDLARLTPRGAAAGGGLLRIPSLGDDWQFIATDLPQQQMLERWRRIFDPLFRGQTMAIGVHPWVLGQKPERLAAFETFVTEVVAAPEIETFSGAEVADWCAAPDPTQL